MDFSKKLSAVLTIITTFSTVTGYAAFEVNMPGFQNAGPIPAVYALCQLDKKGKQVFAGDQNPAIAWSGAPQGTKSFAIVAWDVNVPGGPFYHWLLADIPATSDGIAEGEDSPGLTVGGKPPVVRPYGQRGVNSYTQWFASDKKMAGVYAGYDGPCPPYPQLHHYFFQVLALSVPSLHLPIGFTASAMKKAVQGHVLASAKWEGTYTLKQ